MKTTLRFPLFGTLLGLLAGGCVEAPPPPSLTTSWDPPARACPPDTVWQSIRNRETDLAKPLALPTIADVALQNSPATGKAWHDARAASEQVRYAEGYFLPNITAGAGMTRFVTSAHPDKFDQNSMTYGPGLQLSYLVCNFGGGRNAAIEQALQTVYSANFAFNQAIQDTLLAAETAYYGVISAQAGTEAAATNVVDAKAILDAATSRRDAGLGVELDVLQAQTGYNQALYAQAQAQGGEKIAKGLLAQAMGIPADTPLRIASPSSLLPNPLTRRDIKQLTDEALARRPDLSALRASLAAREAAVKVARAARWPSLYINGSANRDYFELYGQSNRDSQSDDWSYTGGLSVKWPLFDGYQTISSVRTAEALADSLRAQVRQAELAASTEIWARYQNYETALQKYNFSIAALASASALQVMAMDSYKAGVATILDVLSAETQLAQARSQQIAVRQEIFTALANLAYATGVIEKGGTTFNYKTN